MESKKKVSLLQVSNADYNDSKELSQRYSPLHFGYHELLNMGYKIDLLPEQRKCTSKIGNYLAEITLQIECAKKSPKYDLIYYPIDRHCIILAILRKLRLVKCPILMLCHFSLNTDFVVNKKTRLLKKIERYFVFNYFDQVVFPCENLRNIAIEGYPRIKMSGVAHWGAEPLWYGEKRAPSSQCTYYMGCGGTNRDYETLINAVNNMDIKIKIYTSQYQIDKLKLLDPSDNIEFVAAIGENRKDILKDGYSKCRAVLIPIKHINDVPNGATVLVEALAAGKPVLVSDLRTNFIDVEKEGVGLKIEMSNPKAWTAALFKLEKENDYLDKMAQNALSLAENIFNLRNLASDLSKYIDKMLQHDRKDASTDE